MEWCALQSRRKSRTVYPRLLNSSNKSISNEGPPPSLVAVLSTLSHMCHTADAVWLYLFVFVALFSSAHTSRYMYDIWPLHPSERCVHIRSKAIFRVAQNAWVYSLDRSPCSGHKHWDAARGAGFISVSRLRKDRYHFLHRWSYCYVWKTSASSATRAELESWLARVARLPPQSWNISTLGENLAAVNALPTSRRPKRPQKYCVYRSHARLDVDFSWDSVARKNRFGMYWTTLNSKTNSSSECKVRTCPTFISFALDWVLTGNTLRYKPVLFV